MLCHYDAVLPERRASRSGQPGANARWLRSTGAIAVPLEDSLRVPLLTRDLQNTVRALLLRGERDIVLDLARVTRIDAAGVGELIRAYNMSTAADGSLRIVHATEWVREVLERLQLFELLSGSVTQVRQSAR
jgi:anti-anti-sigma regulatory factor